jgi:hypothetical protein
MRSIFALLLVSSLVLLAFSAEEGCKECMKNCEGVCTAKIGFATEEIKPDCKDGHCHCKCPTEKKGGCFREFNKEKKCS